MTSISLILSCAAGFIVNLPGVLVWSEYGAIYAWEKERLGGSALEIMTWDPEHSAIIYKIKYPKAIILHKRRKQKRKGLVPPPIYLLRIAFIAALLSPLNLTSCLPLFQSNSALILPFSVTLLPVVASGPVSCSFKSTV